VHDEQYIRAREFILSEARLLERLLFAVAFEGAASAAVGKLVAAYQNPDGGLGHALEPDVRCPESQPLFCEVGLSALHAARRRDRELALAICSFLEGVSDPLGLVPTLLPGALTSPHAPHWATTGAPGLNPTAGLCGLLLYQSIEHPWLTRATRTCCELLQRNPPRDAHALLCAARLVEHLPDRHLAAKLAERIASALPDATYFIPSAPVTTYGLTPLHFAPTPASPFRRFFAERQIAGHLADFLAKQQADGGWPVTWQAPGRAAQSEWRGKVTLEALSVLVAYGVIRHTSSAQEHADVRPDEYRLRNSG
jgi:hypothetical protein